MIKNWTRRLIDQLSKQIKNIDLKNFESEKLPAVNLIFIPNYDLKEGLNLTSQRITITFKPRNEIIS